MKLEKFKLIHVLLHFQTFKLVYENFQKKGVFLKIRREIRWGYRRDRTSNHLRVATEF